MSNAGVFMAVFMAAGHAHAVLKATRSRPGRCCQYLLARLVRWTVRSGLMLCEAQAQYFNRARAGGHSLGSVRKRN